MPNPTRTTGSNSTRTTAASRRSTPDGSAASAGGDYELPVVHARVPEQLAHTAFWVGLVGAVAAGAVELPVAALVGAGVLVARHRHQS